MGCADFREMLSAELDGETSAAESATAREHLGDCAGCRTWYATASAVTALAVRTPPQSVVTVDESVLDALPKPRKLTAARVTTMLRYALGLLGVAQFLLGAAQIGGVADGHLHVADAIGGTAPNHLWHESAAWNVALGAGFAWIAVRRTRPSGILPTLTAFVAVLALLSVNDVITGRVDYPRLLSHGLVVVGYLLLLALGRRDTERDSPSGDQRRAGSRWRVELDEAPPTPSRTPLRLVTGEASVRVGRARDRQLNQDRAA
ncbi:zf-HC2 domain-containing protein [Micromonospora sp. NBC_01813]|uniref:zf-HC2 domain-containing protein n=1 Tax=Micromonospora sp. NBC_01813 TaxID=2975988 RepID=UPI002DD9EDD7|nr:zf-HC2 domain-containing protein [Micromonospora sp. NBC_01813]WSA10431.1 zf-HC2 domain-containing protein [Micromonospora sp. NBC_01813]